MIAEILTIDFELVLQMSFKALNDSIESDDLILTLLIFDAYSRLINEALTSTITQRAIAMRKTMNEVKRFMIIRRVNNALNIRNESSIRSFMTYL
jgi:hypothetical protein